MVILHDMYERVLSKLSVITDCGASPRDTANLLTDSRHQVINSKPRTVPLYRVLLVPRALSLILMV